jgi:hypothetical protein
MKRQERGTDALISNIADGVSAPIAPIVVELIKKARELADDWGLEQLDSLFPNRPILLLKLERARLSQPGTEERQKRIREIMQIFKEPVSEYEYPDHLIFGVGGLLARERPNALDAVCSNVSLPQRPSFWAGAALETEGRRSAAEQLIRKAEHAAAAIDDGAAHHDLAEGETPNSNESAADSERNEGMAQPAMRRAAVFANLGIIAGEAFPHRRKRWAACAFRTLKQVDETRDRLPLTIEIALKLASREPTLCRREAIRALELLPTFLADGAGFQELRRLLEDDWIDSAQLAIRRQAWEAIVNLAPHVPNAESAWEGPLIERHPEFFALAGYWVTKLGGQVPSAFWEKIETAIINMAGVVEAKRERPTHPEALVRSIIAEANAADKIYSEAPAQLYATMAAAGVLASQSAAVEELYELADHQMFLAYAFRYLPDTQTDWHRLVGRIHSLKALKAAIRRFGKLPLVAKLLPLLKDYPPSEHRSDILASLLDAADDMTVLPPLLGVALDYPSDLAHWTATYVRLCRHGASHLRATITALEKVRQLSPAVGPSQAARLASNPAARLSR